MLDEGFFCVAPSSLSGASRILQGFFEGSACFSPISVSGSAVR